MEPQVSPLTRRPFKNWFKLLQIFFEDSVFNFSKHRDDGFSCFLMGLYHEQGFVVGQDYHQALEYFRLGAIKRDPLCIYRLYEIYSGISPYEVESDRELGLLYLVWAITYIFPVYGSYMCLDFDLEFQAYFKSTLKIQKEDILQTIDDYEDDIFGYDKELIKCVFGFLIEYICPRSNFQAQEAYEVMIKKLINIVENGDCRFAGLFLFKCVIWDFKGVTDKKQKLILSTIRQNKCMSFIFQQSKSIFDYIVLTGKKHALFSRLLHFHSIEVFMQIKHNSEASDVLSVIEACDYLLGFLHKTLDLMDNNFTKALAIYLVVKRRVKGLDLNELLNQILEIIENSRHLLGFSEQDFTFMIGALRRSKLKDEVLKECLNKYTFLCNNKPNTSMSSYEQGKYYQFVKKNTEKAMEFYIRGMNTSPATNSFIQEFYAMKCEAKISKLIKSHEGLYHKFEHSLEKSKLYNKNSNVGLMKV